LGAQGTQTVALEDPTRCIVVVVPVEEDLSVSSPFYKGPLNHTTNPSWKPKLHLSNRNQKLVTNLFTDGTSVQVYEALLQAPAPKVTRFTQVKEKHAKWLKSKTDSKLLYDALTAALEAGMIDEAVSYADELLAYAQDKKEGLPGEVAVFVRAYGAMQKGIKSPATQPSSAGDWQAKLDAKQLHVGGHYALIHWDATGPEVQRRLSMLEDNFRAFFLWHALRGVELPVPEAPLVAVLPRRGSDVLPLARALDGPTRMPADGFYATERDLLVLSPDRLDDVGLTFASQTKQIYRDGVSRDKLLAGEGPPIHAAGLDGKKHPEEVARMQTLALVERLADDQTAMGAISREGTRQLLYATGRLPRYVTLPDWLTQGSANFYARPRDPAFVTNAEGKWLVNVATATGYGGPNYTLQRYFRDLVDKQELNPDRAVLLKNVLTDAYFHGLKDPREARDPDPPKVDTSGTALHAGGQPTTPSAGGLGGSGFQPPQGMSGYGSGTTQQRPPTGGGSGYPSGYAGSGQRPPTGGGYGSIPGGPPTGLGGGLAKPGMSGGQPPLGIGALQPGTAEEENQLAQMRKKRDRLSVKAQATSWALYYYLLKNHPNELEKFLVELAALPRDLPLDGDVVVATFCRAFGLDGSKPSAAKFATEWLDYMRDVPPAGVDIPLVDPKPPTSGTGTLGGPPGLPGKPGGSGGGGGPGDGDR
jgi:hypothetical protein